MESDRQDNEQPSTPADTGYVRGDGAWTHWRNTFALLTGRLTPEGRQQYREDKDRRFEKEDCARCEKYRNFLLSYSVYHTPTGPPSFNGYTS